MPRKSSSSAKAKLALALVEQIRPILAGRDPDVVGAALVELTATLILGHAPEIRDMLLEVHFRAVLQMVRLGPDPFEGEGNGHSSHH